MFKPFYRFTKIGYQPAKAEDSRNTYKFEYELIKGHNDKGQEIKEKYTFEGHDEPLQGFKDCLEGLRKWIAELCEQPKEKVNKIQTRGVSISYQDRESDNAKIPGVVISGVFQYTKSNGVLPLNTPYKLTETLGEGKVNVLGPECAELIESLFEEAEKYIKGERSKIELDYNDEKVDDKKADKKK